MVRSQDRDAVLLSSIDDFIRSEKIISVSFSCEIWRPGKATRSEGAVVSLA
jgi:hypothetical protein